MKILIVITDYGSFNNFMAELAVSLSHENEIHVVCSGSNIINIGDKFDYSKYNLTFHTVDIPRSTSVKKIIKSALEIRKIVKIINPNLVYAHFTTGIFPSILFRKGNIEYWGTFHGLGMNASSGMRKIMFSIVELACFLRLDKRFLINNKDYELVSNMFKENTFKYNSCGVGCDIIKFDRNRFSEIDKVILKQDLNIDGKFVITYTGRFVEFKGFDLVYHSFVKLVEEVPSEVVLLLIGGRDPIHPTGLTEQEENDLFKNKNIINVGYTSEVEKYLAITDVFLFPSKKEGLPVCIVEALAMGVPAVTLDERGNSDVVKNDFNGYLVKSISKSNDINEITRKLKYLFTNRDELDLLSKNCLLNRDKYSRTFFIEEQLKLINDFKKKD
jgi:glycosyltransferase involved in cell wall biosynthesis